jgi:hypothetical protein
MSNNKQIEKPLELPHQETIVGTNTIQTKPFDNQKTMSNNKQSSVEWFLIECGKYGDTAQIPDEVIEQAKEMEAIGKEMSYDDGYAEGYKRAYELMEWCMKNYIKGRVQDHIVDTNKMVDE